MELAAGQRRDRASAGCLRLCSTGWIAAVLPHACTNRLQSDGARQFRDSTHAIAEVTCQDSLVWVPPAICRSSSCNFCALVFIDASERTSPAAVGDRKDTSRRKSPGAAQKKSQVWSPLGSPRAPLRIHAPVARTRVLRALHYRIGGVRAAASRDACAGPADAPSLAPL